MFETHLDALVCNLLSAACFSRGYITCSSEGPSSPYDFCKLGASATVMAPKELLILLDKS